MTDTRYGPNPAPGEAYYGLQDAQVPSGGGVVEDLGGPANTQMQPWTGSGTGTLSASTVLGVFDVGHGHTAASPTLLSAAPATIIPFPATHDHIADQGGIIVTGETVSPDAVSHAHRSDAPTVQPEGSISPAPVTHAHRAEAPALATQYSIAPESAAHGHTAGVAVLITGEQQTPPEWVYTVPPDDWVYTVPADDWTYIV